MVNTSSKGSKWQMIQSEIPGFTFTFYPLVDNLFGPEFEY